MMFQESIPINARLTDISGKFRTAPTLHAVNTVCKYCCSLPYMKLWHRGKSYQQNCEILT